MAAASQVSANNGAGSTVFVVDDEPMLLEMAALLLEPLGYQVKTFRDPQLALSEFSKAKPTVLVTDYAMGAMTGMDLIRECKQINPRQKILLLSGTVDERIYADSTAKPDCFLAKPYQVRDFLKIVQSLASN